MKKDIATSALGVGLLTALFVSWMHIQEQENQMQELETRLTAQLAAKEVPAGDPAASPITTSPVRPSQVTQERDRPTRELASAQAEASSDNSATTEMRDQDPRSVHEADNSQIDTPEANRFISQGYIYERDWQSMEGVLAEMDKSQQAAFWSQMLAAIDRGELALLD